jgi:hypothetical protein
MRVTVEMLEAKGWHRVQTKHGWNLWAHGGIKKTYSSKGAFTLTEAARIYKEREANKERVKIAFSLMASKAIERRNGKND